MMSEQKILISVVIVAMLSVFQILVNGARNRRIRQLPVAVLSLVSMAVGVCAWTGHMDAAGAFCANADFLADGEIMTANIALLL